jgi:L-proline 4-hydroxylase
LADEAELSELQVEEFHREGYLFCPQVFSPGEAAVLLDALAEVVENAPEHVVRERETGGVRMIHGSHLHHDTWRRLSRHPRLVRPARRLLGGPVYVYQSRLNLKEGLAAERPAQGYPWHQDFSTWHLRDGMPEPRALVVFTFLDTVTPANAPLLVVPRSHRRGIFGRAAPAPDGEYRQVVIAAAELRELCEEGGIAAQCGPPGSVLFMHCNLVHGSTENISPFRRALYSIVFSAAANHPTRFQASRSYASRDFTPVEPLADDCLLAR